MQTLTENLFVNHLFESADVGPDPVFSWQMRSERQGAAQSAFRLIVKECGAESTAAPAWDTGVVESDVSISWRYAGNPLLPMRHYVWTVTVRDERGEWLDPASSTFDTGLFGSDAWAGSQWISAVNSIVRIDRSVARDRSTKQEAEDGTAGFVRSFSNPKPVAEAWWCVSGLGVFEAYVNGQPVSRRTSRGVVRDYLKPGFTHFAKTKYSFARDVTPMLRTGAGETNAFAAEVSSGWWRDKIVDFAGERSAFRSVLFLRHPDGTETRVGTDSLWLASGVAGPVVRAAIFDGEDYDSRIPAPWLADPQCATAFGFAPAVPNNEFPGDPIPMTGPSIRVREDLALSPVEAWVWNGADGVTSEKFGKARVLRRYGSGETMTLDAGETLVVDFGQNCAAIPEFVFCAPAGTLISAHPAEMLNDGEGAKARGCDGPEGSAYFTNYRLARTLARYVFSGTGEEQFRPHFTFFGGRYLSIVASGPVEIRSLRWIPVSSIAPEAETAFLETGVADVNRLIANVRWGQLSNYLSVPTDCPQRNERLGWTADTQVFCRSAAYGADVYGFLRKWMRDVRDTQLPNGSFTGVAPTAQYGCDLGEQLGWADAGVIVPWTMWRQFGDPAIVAENWEAMSRYVRLIGKTKFDSPDARSHQWADWLSSEKLESCSGASHDTLPDGSRRPSADALRLWQYLGCCYWLLDSRMMAEMAEPAGRASEKSQWLEEADRALAFIREKFVDPSDGMLVPLFRDMQTPALFALALGVLAPEAARATRDALLENIRSGGDRLKTGFLGTSILMDTLTRDCDAADVAYSLLLQHAFPSWLYSVDQGATTIWERWNSYTKADGFGPNGMNSFNHYAYGAVREWMFRYMAGIREDKTAPGFRRIVLAPVPDPRVGYVRASYRAPTGTIESAWRYEDGKWIWEFAIPANTSATVVLPGEEPVRVASGRHRIERPATVQP